MTLLCNVKNFGMWRSHHCYMHKASGTQHTDGRHASITLPSQLADRYSWQHPPAITLHCRVTQNIVSQPYKRTQMQ